MQLVGLKTAEVKRNPHLKMQRNSYCDSKNLLKIEIDVFRICNQNLTHHGRHLPNLGLKTFCKNIFYDKLFFFH